MGQTKAQAKAKEFGHGWKAAGKVLLKKDTKEIMGRYDTCTAEELAAKVDEAMKFLAESYVELESITYPYDDGEYPSLRVVGFRPATEQEIAEKQAEVDAQAERAREWKERQIAALRQSNPELFKEGN